MKWRNQLLALFCLIVFLGFGVLYFRHWVVQKPFGIILFVGEGLDPVRLGLARAYLRGTEDGLTIDSLPQSALLKNHSLDSLIPDQAAAASALATGTKCRNGSLAVDAEGKGLQNLLELARENGRMTGLVTNALLTDHVPAAFYAQTSTPDNRDELARTLVEAAGIDVVLGGGAAEFLPVRKAGRRADERDLILDLRARGYDLVRDREELDAVPRWRRAKLFGLFSPGELAFADEIEARADQPSLSDMVRRSIELLQFNGGGYLLVVNAGLMGKAARENRAERTIIETLELDQAVSVALRYAGAKSLVMVCGDVGIGGLNLNGFPGRTQDGTAAERGPTSGGRMTWATGPGSPENAEDPAAAAPRDVPQSGNLPLNIPTAEAPAAIRMPAAENCAGDVVALGTGLGADALHGTLENTAIFEIIRENL